MTSCAAISEWNPFHNGHRYLAAQIRRTLSDVTIIAIMSGNYVQRGEPAIIDKWSRAEVALHNGYDLVYELPIWYACQPADYFAYGAVNQAVALGCEYLAFGVETAQFSDYERLADWVVAHPNWEKSLNSEIDARINRGQHKLQQLEILPEQVAELSGLHIDFSAGGNTLLAYSYAKVNAMLGHPLRLLPIIRTHSTHDVKAIADETMYTSSTAIRTYLRRDDIGASESIRRLHRVMPHALATKLCQSRPLPDLTLWYPHIRYLLLSQSSEHLSQHYQMYEGIEHSLVEAAKDYQMYADFIENVTNRQWTVGRIQRALVMLGLDVYESEAFQMMRQRQPLFMLGANQRGRAYLNARQAPAEDTRYTPVSRASRDTVKEWPLWFRADRIYQTFLYPDGGEQNFGRVPQLLT